MGVRKRKASQQLRLNKKNQVSATLKNSPISPRKMRLVVDVIRGMTVKRAIQVLNFIPKHGAGIVHKLLLSAVANWKQKNEDFEDTEIYIKHITVNQAGMLKRLRAAPQGRAHRIRKRANHITIVLGDKKN